MQYHQTPKTPTPAHVRNTRLAALADLPTGRGVLVTAAVFTGQLSIGWSNDYLDAERDRAVHRSDKPVAAGAVAPRAAVTAAVIALILTLALSAGVAARPHWSPCCAAGPTTWA